MSEKDQMTLKEILIEFGNLINKVRNLCTSGISFCSTLKLPDKDSQKYTVNLAKCLKDLNECFDYIVINERFPEEITWGQSALKKMKNPIAFMYHRIFEALEVSLKYEETKEIKTMLTAFEKDYLSIWDRDVTEKCTESE